MTFIFRNFFNWIRQHWVLTIVVAVSSVFILLHFKNFSMPASFWGWARDFFNIGEYHKDSIPPNTVFQRGKTVWDFLDLIIVPLTLSAMVLWFNRIERRREEKVTLERNQDIVLREYIDRMSQLILEKNLRQTEGKSELSVLASILSKTVLSGLDGYRRGLILKFLYESNLVGKPAQERHPNSINSMNSEIVNLEGANFSGAILQDTRLCEAVLVGANLDGANFTKSNLGVRQQAFIQHESGWKQTERGAFLIGSSLRNACLREANLSYAVLDGAILVNADLRNANFQGAYIRTRNNREADFKGANLEGADFSDADLTGAVNFDKAENVSKAIFNNNTVMPDGNVHKAL